MSTSLTETPASETPKHRSPTLRHSGLLLSWALLLLPAAGQIAVSNIRSVQRAGTHLVDIDYDVTGTTKPMKVSVQISTDDGITFPVPVTSLSGAVGANITPGRNLRMTWDASRDWGGRVSNQMRFKVMVDDNPVPDGFALIPEGSFQMGDQSSPLVGESDELPVHSVHVSAFYMAKYEVTKELWDEVRAWGLTHGYTDLSAGNGPYASKGSNHPVHSISWYDMVKWCNARSEKESLTPCYTVSGAVYRTGQSDPDCNWSANGYRLPTEAEWEKAARGGLSAQNFPWGNTISHSQANYNVYSSNGTTNDYSYDVTPRPPATGTYFYHPSYTAGALPYSSPVGSFAPNGYGLYDMAGNMLEWCWDWYFHSYYGSSPGTDPRGVASDTGRVVRGGSWYYDAYQCRVACRRFYDLSYYSRRVGFRPARSSVP